MSAVTIVLEIVIKSEILTNVEEPQPVHAVNSRLFQLEASRNPVTVLKVLALYGRIFFMYRLPCMFLIVYVNSICEKEGYFCP